MPYHIVWLVCAVASGACLDDAVADNQLLKNITSIYGSHALGIWVTTHTAGRVTASLVEIILREALGYRTEITGSSPNGVDAFYALSGCRTPTQISDRGCLPPPEGTYHHVSVEGWTSGYRTTWDDLQRTLPRTALRNLGNMGYYGLSAMYLPSHILEKAYLEEGTILEIYRGFNASWTNASKYFDSPSAIDTSMLTPCNGTRLMVEVAMETYLFITGDWEGIEKNSNSTQGRCFDEYFWYGPSCRMTPSLCVPWITGGNGWDLEGSMQRATSFNMPLALAVAASWTDYTKLPLQVASTFFWWVPDPTFLSLKPTRVAFPPFDRRALERGDRRGEQEAVSIDIYGSRDLNLIAPAVESFLSALVLDIAAVNSILEDQLETGDSDSDVARRWLRANENTWREWVPDPTTCFAQFGLYNKDTRAFVDNRKDPKGLRCVACPSGTFSVKLLDEEGGGTYICQACPRGTAQPSGASLQCDPCPSGEYQDEEGATSCKRCAIGWHQDLRGQDACKRCPEQRTTVGLGSKTLADCGCQEHFIEDDETCLRCPEGMTCPFSSSVHSLRNGTSALGPEYVTALRPGYFATWEDPTRVYRCGDEVHCPGGIPGVCAGGRRTEAIPCAECPDGSYWRDGCVACGPGQAVPWFIAMALYPVAITAAYYMVSTRNPTRLSVKDVGLTALGITLTYGQFVAMLTFMTVKWPASFLSLAGSSQILLLDLDMMSFSCVGGSSGAQRYFLTALFFPASILLILACSLISFMVQVRWTKYLCFCCCCRICRCKRRRGQVVAHDLLDLNSVQCAGPSEEPTGHRQKLSSRKACPWPGPWTRYRTMNLVGHFLQVSFNTLSSLALQPMMCYSHPNGASSLLNYPGVLCGSVDHRLMQVFGSILLALMFTYFTCCTWAAWRIPKWILCGDRRTQGFAFLVSRFRPARWWFGLPLLLRGSLLSLCIVAAPNFPPVQYALGAVVVLSFQLSQVLAWPWKAPLLNYYEFGLVTVLLLLQTTTPSFQDAASPSDIASFLDHLMAWLLGFLAFTTSMMYLVVLHMLVSKLVCNRSTVFHRELGSVVLAKRVRALILELQNMEELDLENWCMRLNQADARMISASVTLMSIELVREAEEAPRNHPPVRRQDLVPDPSLDPLRDTIRPQHLGNRPNRPQDLEETGEAAKQPNPLRPQVEQIQLGDMPGQPE